MICDTLIDFKETEQSKIFPNEAFGYWKVTVERPLRITGVDPQRVYAPSVIRDWKKSCETTPIADPVLRKIYPKTTAPNPLRGLFEMVIDGKPRVVEFEPDTNLRDTEQIPLLEEGGIEAFLKREVLPYAPDAWINSGKTQIGYEISFTRYFYKPVAMRSLEEIVADIKALEQETDGLLEQIIKAEGQ